MTKVTLKDLLPEQMPEFKIGPHTVQFRKANIYDMNFMGEDMKGKVSIDMTTKQVRFLDMNALSVLAFRLLQDEFKPLFKSETGKVYDERTETTVERTLKPYEVMAKHLAMEDSILVMEHLFFAMGYGDLPKDVTDQIAANSKKKATTKTPRTIKKTTGRKSTTSSQVNTGTP